jgi:hypothetical protein
MGIVFVDESIGQEWPNNWFPMATGMGVNRPSGFID